MQEEAVVGSRLHKIESPSTGVSREHCEEVAQMRRCWDFKSKCQGARVEDAHTNHDRWEWRRSRTVGIVRGGRKWSVASAGGSSEVTPGQGSRRTVISARPATPTAPKGGRNNNDIGPSCFGEALNGPAVANRGPAGEGSPNVLHCALRGVGAG